MAFRLPPRRYYTFEQLIERWGCEADDVRDKVCSGELVPSMYFDYVRSAQWVDEEDIDFETGEEFQRLSLHPSDHRSGPASGFFYLVAPRETGAHSCEFMALALHPNAAEQWRRPGDDWQNTPFVLSPDHENKPTTLRDVEERGVFMHDVVTAFEQQYIDREDAPASRVPAAELSTRPRRTLLRIVYAMARGGYKFDPAAPASNVPSEIESDAAAAGVPVTAETIRGYLREAAREVAPSKANSSRA